MNISGCVGVEVVLYLRNRAFACHGNCNPCVWFGRLYPHHFTFAGEANRTNGRNLTRSGFVLRVLLLGSFPGLGPPGGYGCAPQFP